MQINWLGQGCFKIITKDEKGEKKTILFDPIDPDSGIKMRAGSYDIVVLSHNGNIDYPVKGNVLLDVAGEYEIHGIPFLGKEISQIKNDSGIILWRTKIEEISIGHLGPLNKPLSEVERGFLTGVEVLIVPAGGKDILSVKEATEVIQSLEPKIIIPSYFTDIKPFCRESTCPSEKLDKINLKKKDLPQEGMKMIILNPHT